MEQVLIAIVTTLGQEYLASMLGILLVWFTVYSNRAGLTIMKATYDIHKQYKNEIRNFVRAQLDSVIFTAVERATTIIAGMPPVDCSMSCGINPLDVQLASYESRLEVVIRTYMADKVHICLLENGFDKMDGEQLDEYIKSTATNIWKETQRRVRMYKRSFPNILEYQEKRYTQEEATQIYRAIVMKHLRLKELEKAEIKELRRQHSIITKLKFWRNQ